MPYQDSPRCTVCQKLAEALIESVCTAHAARAALDAALRRPSGDSATMASVLQASRDAALEAETAVRDHLEQHRCKG